MSNATRRGRGSWVLQLHSVGQKIWALLSVSSSGVLHTEHKVFCVNIAFCSSLFKDLLKCRHLYKTVMFHIKIICICILHLWCWQIWLRWYLASIECLWWFWLDYFRAGSHWKAFDHQFTLFSIWDLWLIWGQEDHILKHSQQRP